MRALKAERADARGVVPDRLRRHCHRGDGGQDVGAFDFLAKPANADDVVVCQSAPKSRP